MSVAEPSILVAVISSLFSNLPLLMVWLVGLYYAYLRREAPFASYVLIGLSLMIMTLIAGRFISIWLPIALSQQGYSTLEMGTFLGLTNFVLTLINAGAWILILMALFRGRGSKAKHLYEDD